MNSTRNILCVGELLVDCYDGLKTMGGAPANVAAVAARLGSRSFFLGKIGADSEGDFLIEEMIAHGVQVEHVVRDADAPTAIAHVSLDESGERTFQFRRGADERLRCDEVAPEVVQMMELVHFGSATAMLEGAQQTTRDTYFHLLQMAKANRAYISFDANYREALWGTDVSGFRQAVTAAMAYADFVKLSEHELFLLTGTEQLTEALHKLHALGVRIVTVTLGADGAILSDGYQIQRLAALPVDVVDTTGAGDAFVAAVLHQLAANATDPRAHSFEDWTQMVVQANRIGAVACTKVGALTAFTESGSTSATHHL